METTSETYAGRYKRSELDPEIARILLKIMDKWQRQTVQNGGPETKSAVPVEEMETVIIPAYYESVQSMSPVEEELTETVILSPLAYGANMCAAEECIEEIPETVIIRSEDALELSPSDEISSIEMETIVQGRVGVHPVQPQPSEEERLDETIVLPPRKETGRRRGVRQRNE